MKQKLLERKKANNLKLPQDLLNPLCDFVLTKFEEGESALFRIDADNGVYEVIFNMHIEVKVVDKIREL